MAMTRDWTRLSPSYRRRLQRGGITQQAYESGASLKKARGHDSSRKKGRRRKKRHSSITREALENEIIRLKKEHFGSSLRFNDRRSAKAVRQNKNGKPHSINSLRKSKGIIDNMIDSGYTFTEALEYLGMADYDDDPIDSIIALFYH